MKLQICFGNHLRRSELIRFLTEVVLPHYYTIPFFDPHFKYFRFIPMLFKPIPAGNSYRPALILAVSANLTFSQNNGLYCNMIILTVVLSKFDNICELQPEYRLEF